MRLCCCWQRFPLSVFRENAPFPADHRCVIDRHPESTLLVSSVCNTHHVAVDRHSCLRSDFSTTMSSEDTFPVAPGHDDPTDTSPGEDIPACEADGGYSSDRNWAAARLATLVAPSSLTRG